MLQTHSGADLDSNNKITYNKNICSIAKVMNSHMKNKKHWKNIAENFRIFAKFAITGVSDSLFVIIWVVLQSKTSEIVSSFDLTGEVDRVVFVLFQYLFAISTLIPIATYILKDLISNIEEILIVIKKARQRVSKKRILGNKKLNSKKNKNSKSEISNGSQNEQSC